MPDNAKTKTISLPNSLTILKRATKLGICGELIKTLNYIDLQILIFSLDIDELTQYIKTLKQQNDEKNGISKRMEASEEDFNSL